MNRIKMTRILCLLLVFCSLWPLDTSASIQGIPVAAAARALQPEYAKWGRIAMIRTKEKYRTADIVDYLHVGRTQVSPAIAEEEFKLWLKDGSREFGVRVTIRFFTANDQVIFINDQETSS